MTSKIRVLSDHTINKIAAGEVIENTASVVKELVENALDAGSTEICIEIKGGGRQLIRISDNGSGMNADDAILCLERHATSKIRAVEEIHEIGTMGFRGEAIPSIAAISKFTILTRSQEDTGMGTMVIVDGGSLISCSPAPCSTGTVMEVKSLFFNVPVRKKFLKSPSFDANEILKIISMIALGNPHIAFKLISDGKVLLSTPPMLKTTFQEQLKERISSIVGDDYLNNCCYVNGEKLNFKIEGFVGLPSYTRHNRSGQYLFINKRSVSSPIVAYAIKDAYGSALATGRHPVFTLHLTIPGDMVDVNVHPQKREVRLRQEPMIREMIVSFVAKALQSDAFYQSPQYRETLSPIFAQTYKTTERKFEEEWNNQTKSSPFSEKSYVTTNTWQARMQTPLPVNLERNDQETLQYVSQKVETPCFFSPSNSKVTLRLKLIGTIPRYLILENLETEIILFIDQRGAHARILYEKLLKLEEGQILAQQTLLLPYQLECSPFEAETLRSALEILNGIGIHIQEFGPNRFLIDAIPQIFGDTDIEKLIQDIVRDLQSFSFMDDQIFKQKRLKQLALVASRSAISKNSRLSLEEAQKLVDDLIVCEHPYQCPSGKSIIAKLTEDDLTRLFSR